MDKVKKKYRKISAYMENIPKIATYRMLEVNGADTSKKIPVRFRQKTLCDIGL